MKKRKYDLTRPAPDQNVRVDMQFTGDLAARIAAIAEKTGVSAHLIRDAMDHADIKTSEHYVRLAASDLEEAMGKLNHAARAKC